MKALRAIARRGLAQHGFSLIETLVAVALMGLILSILAVVTAQWSPHWQAGFSLLQRTELVGLGLDRVASDLAAAEFIAPIGEERVLFYGSESAVTFVRSPIGPKPSTGPAPTGLEIIRFANSEKEGGLVRSRIAFSPAASVGVSTDDFEFSDASLLLRAPLRLSFAFAGPDRTWVDSWDKATVLPAAVRITVSNADSGETLAVSTATLIHVNTAAICASATPSSQCGGGQSTKGGGQPPPNDATKPANGEVL
ncbi:PulJ/GspJ family protein [Methylocella tundrae]|uniref:Putative general secretion pathway protein J n=1 Tax=Methylocella tundrae TaxID=227605 RepID=A0A4U8Z055_METTU|nr:type II secretion system protein [Methylocella tundrae]WPP05717.1 type II secretion system protein [Methylocella tundrae]VFU08203.1 putative general secretion pathway protein J [Methylocella tundrae]